MSLDVKISRPVKRDGEYCVNVKPKNAPKDSMGAGGKIVRFDSKAEALTYRRLYKKLERTPTNDEITFITKRGKKRTNAGAIAGLLGGLTVFAVALKKGKLNDIPKAVDAIFLSCLGVSSGIILTGTSHFLTEKKAVEKLNDVNIPNELT